MKNQIQISKFKLFSAPSSSLKATASILINEAIEIIGFTVLHNKTYDQPVVKCPAAKKNNKYTSIIKIHDQELDEAITELILTKYYEETKTEKQG